MSPETIAALDAINRRFYSEAGDDFDETRRQPWAGWQEVLRRVTEARGCDAPLKVLDLGCGNARFAAFLHGRAEAPAFEYTGVDASAELLSSAGKLLRLLESQSPGAPGEGLLGWRLRLADLLGQAEEPLGKEPDLPADFDLVTLFGLLHHVPAPLQSGLLRHAAGSLGQGGVLALSFWQFGELDRFRQRRLPWSWAVERGLLRAEQVAEIDADDWLLPWGDPADGRARYCRFVDEDEADELVEDLTAGTRITELDRFRADGRTRTLNLYVLLRRA